METSKNFIQVAAKDEVQTEVKHRFVTVKITSETACWYMHGRPALEINISTRGTQALLTIFISFRY